MAQERRRPDAETSSPLKSVFCDEHGRDNPTEIQIQELAASRARLQAVADVLEWLHSLQDRLRIAQLRWELVGLSLDEWDAIVIEAEEALLIARRLKWGLRRPKRREAA
jgi:hypothetical protein